MRTKFLWQNNVFVIWLRVSQFPQEDNLRLKVNETKVDEFNT